MSKPGKFSFLFAFLFFVALMLTRLLLGGWHDGMWGPLILSLGFFVFAIYKEHRFLADFFTMRTTKHGLNMGVLILITLVLLTVMNVFAVRYEKKFDWTKEGLNSLSPQSTQAAKALKQDTEVVLLYRKEQLEENVQRTLADLVAMYKNVSDKIKFSSYNVLQRPDLAQKYEFANGPFGVFAVQGEKRIKIDKPNEEGITQALIKLGREKKKVIYLTTGHGERELEERKPEAISEFRSELLATYDVKPLTLYQAGNQVPDDAAVVAVLGPQQEFLEGELQALREYARRGGHLLIAIDPGQKHNIALLTKTLGVEFKNNYVLDPRAQIPGAGNIAALGVDFSRESEVTKSFQVGMYSIFLLASALQKAPDAASTLIVEDLVKSDGAAVTTQVLDENPKLEQKGIPILAQVVTGRLPAGRDAKQTPEGQEFSAVIFGDSDFLSNALFSKNLNRDLAMNAMAWLAADKDLISIRPKEPKGSKLELTNTNMVILFLGYLGLILALFFMGGWIWWRRRTA